MIAIKLDENLNFTRVVLFVNLGEEPISIEELLATVAEEETNDQIIKRGDFYPSDFEVSEQLYSL